MVNPTSHLISNIDQIVKDSNPIHHDKNIGKEDLITKIGENHLNAINSNFSSQILNDKIETSSNHSTPPSRRIGGINKQSFLRQCTFETTDGIEYLRDKNNWFKRLSYRISSSEEIKNIVLEQLAIMIVDLEANPNQFDLILEKIFSQSAESTYLSGISSSISKLDFEKKKEIEGCFCASILRYVILNNQSPIFWDPESFKERLSDEYDFFLRDHLGNNVELIYLCRFERALMLCKKYISGNRKKGLLLIIATLLEGSEDHIRYITGGHSTKETKRRVGLIEYLYEIKPRKRTKRLLSRYLGQDINVNKIQNTALYPIDAQNQPVIPVNPNSICCQSSSLISPQFSVDQSASFLAPITNIQKPLESSAFDHELFYTEFYKRYFPFLKAIDDNKLDLCDDLHEEIKLYLPHENFDPHFSNRLDYIIAFRIQLELAEKELQNKKNEAKRNPQKSYTNYKNLRTKLEELNKFFDEFTSIHPQSNQEEVNIDIQTEDNKKI